MSSVVYSTENMSGKFEIKPYKVISPRVWRTYKGGSKIDEWKNLGKSIDTDFPEEWIASTTKAINKGREHIVDEGLSKVIVDGNEVYLKDLISSAPSDFLGVNHFNKFGNNTAVLVKCLDAAERLSIQVHPDNNKALKLFNSTFGKTESWYVVGGRYDLEEQPYILLGFKEGIDESNWIRCFEQQDIEGMKDCLHKVYVKNGDVFLIKGGLPHAIGAGCFIIEVQEPTDYTIRTERQTQSGLPINEYQCHQGLGFELMFECFNYDGCSMEELFNKYKLTKRGNSLISYNDTDKFALEEYIIDSEISLPICDNFYILIALENSGKIIFNNEVIEINQGEHVFVPANLNVLCNSDNSLKLLVCHPPKS